MEDSLSWCFITQTLKSDSLWLDFQLCNLGQGVYPFYLPIG